MVGKKFDVFGWTGSYPSADYADGYQQQLGSIVQTEAVFDLEAAAQKIIDDALAAAKKIADDLAASLLEDDGASSVTTYASALVAVGYALAF
jgi:hypothetical protein